MNFFKRGLQSSWAKKGRTLLLCGVFSAILIFVLAGLTIRSAALSATESAKKSVGATVTLSTNREAAFGGGQENAGASDGKPTPGSFSLTPVNLSDAEAIAGLANVKSYSFESSSSANAGDDIEAISTEDDTSSDSLTEAGGDNLPNGMGEGMPDMAGGLSQSDFQITGVVATDLYSDFSEGTAEIIEGQGISETDEGSNHAIIETALAEANDLTVGDTFTITTTDTDTEEETTYEMTIIGIYETSDTGSSMGMMFNFLNPANTIFTSYTFANTLKGSDATGTIDSAVYTLEDPKEMESFVSEAEEFIDTDTFSLQTNDQAYQQMLQPLNNVASFAQNIVVLVAVAGIIILTLIIMITIRERRYEIGVLLSLGESRIKVILQFFTEIVICMMIALGIASLSGNFVGNIVGEQLLAQQSETTQVDQQLPNGMDDAGGRGGNSDGPGVDRQMPGGDTASTGLSSIGLSDEVAALDIAVKPKELLALAGFGLLISFLSILFSSIGILRLNPKKILVD